MRKFPKSICLIDVPDDVRRELLERLPPTCGRTLCRQVTLVYDCGPRFRVPWQPLAVEIYGVVRKPGVEVLACRVAGDYHRPDGLPYWITHSLDAGHAPVEGGRFAPAEVMPLEPITGYDEIGFEGRAVCRTASVI